MAQYWRQKWVNTWKTLRQGNDIIYTHTPRQQRPKGLLSTGSNIHTHTHTHRPRHHSPYEVDDLTPVFRSLADITLTECHFYLHIWHDGLPHKYLQYRICRLIVKLKPKIWNKKNIRFWYNLQFYVVLGKIFPISDKVTEMMQFSMLRDMSHTEGAYSYSCTQSKPWCWIGMGIQHRTPAALSLLRIPVPTARGYVDPRNGLDGVWRR
jgi:hypothetical protein